MVHPGLRIASPVGATDTSAPPCGLTSLAAQVAAVNYEARAYGLFNRISVEEALRRCAGLVLVRGDNAVNGMQRYRSASHGVLRVVMQSLDSLVPAHLRASWHGRPVETPSFDDIFVRFDEGMASAWQAQSSCPAPGLHAAASDWARSVRVEILRQEGLTCSAGIASTKLAAALATKKNKPNGQWCVEAGGESAFVASARLQGLKGAGITGLPPAIRSKVSPPGRAIPPGRRAFLRSIGLGADAELNGRCNMRAFWIQGLGFVSRAARIRMRSTSAHTHTPAPPSPRHPSRK